MFALLILFAVVLALIVFMNLSRGSGFGRGGRTIIVQRRAPVDTVIEREVPRERIVERVVERPTVVEREYDV